MNVNIYTLQRGSCAGEAQSIDPPHASPSTPPQYWPPVGLQVSAVQPTGTH